MFLRSIANRRLAALAVAVATAGVIATVALAAPGDIRTLAGNGTPGYAGDNGPATAAEIQGPRGIATLPGGGYLIADSSNNRIRKVTTAGVITTVAGDGSTSPPFFGGDGG